MVSEHPSHTTRNVRYFSPGSDENRLPLRRVGNDRPGQGEAYPLALLADVSVQRKKDFNA